MPKETMSPRERWTAVLEGKIPDRVPMFWQSTVEVINKTKKYFHTDNLEDVYRKFHLDNTVGVSPRYIGPEIPADYNIYGIKLRKVEHKTGFYYERVSHPLAGYNSIEEIEKNYKWPTADWYDFSVIKKQVEGKDDYPVKGGGSEPFLVYKDLRGEEQGFIDLIENPDIVEYCLDKLFDFCYQTTSRIYETIPGKVMITVVAEDFGGQETLMYSPAQIRKFFIPRMKKMMDLARQEGAYVFFHSDGAVRDILPDMIEAGIDILNPVQWRCKGMEREGLKKDFGDKIVFHGAVDNQKTLPFGTPDEVKQEVIDNINILGKNGGYFLGPCHNMQALTPVENIIAMYETGYEYGWY
jgi:uroporphyrinogen decarboxylase